MSSLPEVALWLLSVASAALWIRRGTAIDSDGDAASKSGAPLQIPFGLVDAVVFFLFWLSALQVVQTVAALGPQRSAGLVVAISLVSILVVAIAVRVWNHPYPEVGEWFSWPGRAWGPLWVASLRRWLMILPPLMLIHRELLEWVPYEHPTIEQLVSSREVGAWIGLWLSAVVAAPLVEEVFFRGVLLQALINAHRHWRRNWTAVVWGRWLAGRDDSRRAPDPALRLAGPGSAPSTSAIGFWWPVIVSAGLFGAVHAGQGLAPIPLFLLGLFLGVLARKTRSLWSCVLVHALFNAYTMLWVQLSVLVEMNDR